MCTARRLVAVATLTMFAAIPLSAQTKAPTVKGFGVGHTDRAVVDPGRLHVMEATPAADDWHR